MEEDSNPPFQRSLPSAPENTNSSSTDRGFDSEGASRVALTEGELKKILPSPPQFLNPVNRGLDSGGTSGFALMEAGSNPPLQKFFPPKPAHMKLSSTDRGFDSGDTSGVELIGEHSHSSFQQFMSPTSVNKKSSLVYKDPDSGPRLSGTKRSLSDFTNTNPSPGPSSSHNPHPHPDPNQNPNISSNLNNNQNLNQNPSLNPNLNPDQNTNFIPIQNPNQNPNHNPNVNPHQNANFIPIQNPNLNPSHNPNLNPNQNNFIPIQNPDLNPNHSPNLNPTYNPNMNPNLKLSPIRNPNPNPNQGMQRNMMGFLNLSNPQSLIQPKANPPRMISRLPPPPPRRVPPIVEKLTRNCEAIRSLLLSCEPVVVPDDATFPGATKVVLKQVKKTQASGSTSNSVPSAALGRQMTILYGNQSHVFENIHPTKVRQIMAYAGSSGPSMPTSQGSSSTSSQANSTKLLANSAPIPSTELRLNVGPSEVIQVDDSSNPEEALPGKSTVKESHAQPPQTEKSSDPNMDQTKGNDVQPPQE